MTYFFDVITGMSVFISVTTKKFCSDKFSLMEKNHWKSRKDKENFKNHKTTHLEGWLILPNQQWCALYAIIPWTHPLNPSESDADGSQCSCCAQMWPWNTQLNTAARQQWHARGNPSAPSELLDENIRCPKVLHFTPIFPCSIRRLQSKRPTCTYRKGCWDAFRGSVGSGCGPGSSGL